MPKKVNSEDRYILSLDEGTTSARALLFDNESMIKGLAQYEFPQIFPRPGWVEQNPQEIWEAQKRAFKDVLKLAKVDPSQVAGIGVTNQRETTILWDRKTGVPVYNAIVWQCRRTTEYTELLKKEYGGMIKSKTGLIPDSYFSGPKIKWLLENKLQLRDKAKRGEIAFGTVDSYLIFKLSGGKIHVVDYTNASRTMLFNIHNLRWDEDLLELLDIPEQILPAPKYSSEIYGYTDPKVFSANAPIAGDIGDQQAALFGHTAFDKGVTKCTYGTGNFLLMNTGREPSYSDNLLTTIAWGLRKEVVYALEGSIFITGAAVQWLKDSLQIINSGTDAEEQASSLNDNEGVYLVPAFVGLGAPYWDQYARGLIIGLTRGTGRRHFARATLEAIAYLTRDVTEALETSSGTQINVLRVDGGACKNNFLMQFQADILRKNIIRPSTLETTALGAAYMAGLAVDFWNSLAELKSLERIDMVFKPKIQETKAKWYYDKWKKAVERSRNWIQP